MTQAPYFHLQDQDNKTHSLADYRGSWVILYFYPKDDTPGCTTEACNFRDAFSELEKLGVQVLGISKDSVTSHKKFADKYHLAFPILSDESTETIKAYNAWLEHPPVMRSHIIRKTFLINPEGEIAKEYPKVDPITHAKEILTDLQTLKQK